MSSKNRELRTSSNINTIRHTYQKEKTTNLMTENEADFADL